MDTPRTGTATTLRPLLAYLTDRVATRGGALLVVAIWLLLAVGLNVAAARYPAPDRVSSDLPTSVEASRAAALAQQKFPGQHGSPALIVYARSGGLTAYPESSSYGKVGVRERWPWSRAPLL